MSRLSYGGLFEKSNQFIESSCSIDFVSVGNRANTGRPGRRLAIQLHVMPLFIYVGQALQPDFQALQPDFQALQPDFQARGPDLLSSFPNALSFADLHEGCGLPGGKGRCRAANLVRTLLCSKGSEGASASRIPHAIAESIIGIRLGPRYALFRLYREHSREKTWLVLATLARSGRILFVLPESAR